MLRHDCETGQDRTREGLGLALGAQTRFTSRRTISSRFWGDGRGAGLR